MQHTSRGLVLILALTVFHGAKSESCDQEQLIKCANPIKQLAENEFGFYTSKDVLEKMCPHVKDSLKCIENFTLRCWKSGRRDYFNKLYAGTHAVITELCENGEYQKEFLRHQPCLREVRKEHDECAQNYQEKLRSAPRVAGTGGAKGGEEKEAGDGGGGGTTTECAVSAEESAKYLQTVCCSFQRYLQCSKHIVMDKCGSDTAEFTERFLDRMAGPLIENHCEGYDVGSDKCEDSSPSSTSRLSSHLSLLLLLTYFLRTLFPST